MSPGLHLCAAAALLALVPLAAGHGYLAFPPMRGGAAGSPANVYCPQCGNGAGVCGDGGQWGAGSDFLAYAAGPTTTLAAGQTVEFVVVVTAWHMGHFQFSICDQALTHATADPQGCLNQHILTRAPPPANCTANDPRGDCQPIQAAYPERWYLPPSTGTYTMKFVIPSDLRCSACTLQWRWWTANSCIPAPGYGCFFAQLAAAGWNTSRWCGSFCGTCGGASDVFRAGCGEEFRNCADVAVVGGPQLPTPSAPAGTTTKPGASPSPVTTTLAPAPMACVVNANCTANPWCTDQTYVAWCAAQTAAGACPAPQCTLATASATSTNAATASTTGATSQTSSAAPTSGTTAVPAATSSTTTGTYLACVPVGDCGALGFCDQTKFRAFCSASSGAQCPGPFCRPQSEPEPEPEPAPALIEEGGAASLRPSRAHSFLGNALIQQASALDRVGGAGLAADEL